MENKEDGNHFSPTVKVKLKEQDGDVPFDSFIGNKNAINASLALIKAEMDDPENEDLPENVYLHYCTKLQQKIAVKLENFQELNEHRECILNSSDPALSNSLFPTQKETVKAENLEDFSDLRGMHEIFHSDEKTENEVNVTEGELMENETSSSSIAAQDNYEDSATDETSECDNPVTENILNCLLKPTEDDNFKCDQCNFQTVHKRSFKMHLLRHKKPEEVNMFKCDQCSFQTMYRSYIKMHMLKHKKPEELELFKCDKCDYQSTCKRNVQRHSLKHKNPEELHLFKCDQCDYKTVRKRNVLRHQLKHKKSEEVKVFKCDQCNYQTIWNCNLKTHLQRHEKSRKFDLFKCDQCDFQSNHKYVYKSHLLRHKNPKEADFLKCVHCDFQTVYKRKLKTHMLRHENSNENDILKCHLCDYQTLNKINLRHHCLRHRTRRIKK